MKGEFIYGNKVAEDLVGYKKDELIGQNFLQCGLLSGKDIPYAAKLLAKSLLGKPTGPDQLKLMRKDGTTVEIEISSQVMNVGGQKIIMGMAQDISERKKTEERIRLMAELLDLSPASIIVHDFEGNILFANKVSLEMHGYTEDEFKGLTLRDIDTPESAELIQERIKIIKEKGELSFEVSHRRKDGSSFPLLVNTKIANINDREVLLSVSSDITEKKLKEEELRQKTEELDNYFTNALDLFCIADTDGHFIRLNEQWENVLGYPLSELEGARFLDFVHPEDLNATLEAISVLSAQQRLIGFTNRYRAKNGTYKFIEWRSYPAGKRIYAAARDITDRKLAEDALRQSEEMFRSYVENAPDAIMVVDEKGNYVMVNDAACVMTGYSKDELLRMHIMDVTYPEDFAKGQEHFKNVVEKGEAKDEVRYVTKQGEVRYWSVKAVKLNDKRFLGFQTDITERKLSEIALKESEERYSLVVDASEQGIWDWNVLTNQVYYSPQWKKQIGYEVDEIKNDFNEWIEHLHEDDRARCLNAVEEYIKNPGKHFILEFRFRHKNGSYIWIHNKAASIINEEGKVVRMFGAHTDITERKLAEESLKESEERYRTFIESTDDMAFVKDENFRYLMVNNVLADLFGKIPDEVIGKEDYELMSWEAAEDCKKSDLRAINEGRLVISEEVSSGKIFETRKFPVRFKNGKLGVGGYIRDITEQRKAQEAIKLSEVKFNRAFHASPVAMSIQDYQDIFWDVNDAFLNLTGYTRDEIVGHTGKELNLWANSEQRKHVNELFKKHETVRNFEFQFRKKDGSSGVGILSAELISIDGKDAALTAVLDITDRQQALDALKKSELYLNKSQQVARIGSYLYDIKKGNWIASKTLDEIFGIDENYNKNVEGWLSIIHPEYQQVMANHLLKHVIEGKNRFDKEYKIIRVSDGVEIWVHGIGELEFDMEGNPIFLIGTIQDITERKRAEEAIKESEEKFRILFDTMPNGYYRSTPEGYFVDANPSFINMLGYENLDELKALHIPTEVFVQSSEREEILTSNPEFVSNVETYRLKRKDGSVIWVEDNARYIKDENGNVLFNEGICKDITDRKKAEDALRESEQLFNTLAQVSPVGIFRTRPDGYTTYVNPKWVRLAGISAEKAMGDGWLEAVHPEDREKIKGGWNLATKDNDVSVAEYRFLRPDGNIIWVMGQAIPEFDAFNNIAGYVGTITDITERKLAEEALSESEERLRILAEKTGTIVYDRNLKSNIVHREGAIEEVLGYTKEEYNSFTVEQFNKLLHPEDLNTFITTEEKIFLLGGNLTQYYRLRHKNGHYVYIEDNSVVLIDEQTKTRRLLGSMKDITQRKLSEIALIESEERLRILAEKTGTIVYDRDLINHIVHREGAIEEVLGYTREELNNFEKDQLENMIDEKDKEQYLKNIKDILKVPGSYSLNYKLRHKNGKFIFIEDNGIVLLDESGNPVRILGSMRDVTLKKLAEDELRKLSHAVEQSQVSIVITNKEGIIEYVNPKFCDVTGYTYEEAIGQNPRILKSGEWASETYTGMWSDLASGRGWTGIFHNKKKNGELFWESAHISPIKDFSGEITHYIAVKEDITEKVKNEEQLARYREHLEEMVEERTAQINSQNEFLRSLIDTIPNPLFVKDSEGKYTDVNPAFEKLSGKKRDELIGKKMDIVLDGEAKKIAFETDEQLLKEKGIVSYESNFITGEGKKIAILVYKASFGAHDNKPEGIVGIFFDISQRKEMEEKTIQALSKEKELNEMKTNFISMASHEFRTPLTTILASADLVEMYYNKWSEEKVINHVKKIQDSVNYMTSLLDDVLTLSRADRGKIKFSPSKQNLKELCSQLMNETQYQTLPGHELVMDYKLKEEILNVDSKLLTQILNNLLSNAVKFSPEGGKILLEVTQKDNKIQFIVQDEGLGIDMSDLKNIFEPFFRGKNVTEIHGSGLGLNIVRNAVELHGGEIFIESELNKGTKITFTIRPS